MRRAIHVVDNDDAIRASLCEVMTVARPIPVLTYADAETFLECQAELDPGVVLLEVRMPGISGIELLERIGTVQGKFVPIMVSGQGDIALAVRAMKLGAFDFLMKPIDPARLLASIDAALGLLDVERAAELAIRSARARVDRLSRRERDVFVGLVRGWPNKIIAYKLDLSPRTVEIHRANLMEKLEAKNLSEALRIAFNARLLDEVMPLKVSRSE